MAKVSPLQCNFIGGEFSPLLYGRADSERYGVSLAVCKNYIPIIQGPVTRRPGTYYTAATKDSSKKSRLMPFEFSTTQAYILEVGDQYIRFYRNNGVIESSPGVAYEIATTYLEAHLFELKITQNADVLFITHPLYAPRKLSRVAHTNWTLTTIDFLDGPYQAQNVGATTLTPSATSGTGITITASAATFVSTDVGRLIRIKHSATWGYAKITAYTSTTIVTADVKSNFGATSAVTIWRLGLWSDTTGYPSTVTFHEDRLFFAGCTSFPQRLDGSRSGDYENFAPTDVDGTIVASHALGFSLNANDVNVIRWMTSDEKGLLVGTVGGEWYVRAASTNEALNPANVSAKKSTSYGSANVQPVQVGKAALFIQRAGRKLRDMQFYYDVDGFRAADMSLLSEHITAGGIKQLAFQKEPQQIVWCVRGDGALIGMTYERDDQEIKVGWHRHILGGYGDGAQGICQVESVATIPAADGTRDELWIVVKRYINGQTKRYVEFLTKLFEDTDDQQDAFFVDCGASYDVPITMTAATKASPVVITAASHGLVDGDKIRIAEVKGMTEINGTTYVVANKTANTFELNDSSGNAINGTNFTTYVSGGEVRKLITTISGLSHLEGETVDILADGAVLPSQVVTGGSITLTSMSAVVHVGYGYNSDGQMLRLEAGSEDGTSIGKTRRIHRVGFYLHRSLGLEYGMSFDDLDTVTFRNSSDSMTRAPALFSGILSENIESDYDFENQICWRQSQPLPSTILSVMPQMVTQDRG
jgi:hypothetical protein